MNDEEYKQWFLEIGLDKPVRIICGGESNGGIGLCPLHVAYQMSRLFSKQHQHKIIHLKDIATSLRTDIRDY